jgi:hypothetical protein
MTKAVAGDGRTGTVSDMEASVDFTLAFEEPDEAG